MKFCYVFVGKTQFLEIDKMINRYLEKLRRFVKVDVKIVREERITKSKTDEEILNSETERILKCISLPGLVVAWDRKGKMLSSREYADLIGKWELNGVRNVWMVVGSAIGLSQAMLKKANEVLSLSSMTFPHDLSRLIVVEQTYRAFTIIRGIPYHR